MPVIIIIILSSLPFNLKSHSGLILLLNTNGKNGRKVALLVSHLSLRTCSYTFFVPHDPSEVKLCIIP